MATTPKSASEKRHGIDADVMALRVMMAKASDTAKSEALSRLAKIVVQNLVDTGSMRMST